MKAVCTLFFVLLSVAVAAPAAASPRGPVAAWCYNLLSREWQFYENNEHAEWEGPKLTPQTFYTKTVSPEGCGNVLIVTLWGTVHARATSVLLRCTINTVACNTISPAQASGAFDGDVGWQVVFANDLSNEDVGWIGISRSWCLPVTSLPFSPATVKLELENKDDDHEVSIETADFEIVEAGIADATSACVEGSYDGNATNNEDPPAGLPLPGAPALPRASTTTVPAVPTVPALPTLP